MNLQHHHIQQCLCLILRNKCPCSNLIFKRIGKPVIQAFLNQFSIAVIVFHLTADFFFFFLRKLAKIQLIAEGSSHSHHTSCFHRCASSCLMIRNCRNMGAYSGHRIGKGGSILDFDPVCGIRIVTAPDLRCIIQHSGIKSSAAAAAALDQKIRIARNQPLQKVIKAKYIVMQNFSLVGCSMRENISNASVHIPLDVFNVSLVKQRTDLLKNRIYDFFSGEIQYQLISSSHRFSSRNRKCPVRMRTVEIAVFIDHLRLNPDTEFHTEIIDFFNQFSQRHSQLLLIDIPVAETAVVIVSFAKPAVIHDQHLNSKICRFFGKIVNRLSGKIKIRCFPAVYQNRSYLISVFSTAKMCAIAFVEVLGKSAKTFPTETHHDFRRPEGFPRCKRIRKLFFLQSKLYPCLLILVTLCLTQETAAVYKGHRIAFACILCGPFLCQNHHRIVLMTGGSTAASDYLCTMSKKTAVEVSLHSMTTVERNQIIPSCDKIKTGTLHLLNRKLLTAVISDLYTSRNDVILR